LNYGGDWMNEEEALLEIQRMDLEEKIAALSPTDKAYIKGYIERALLETRKVKRLRKGKEGKEKGEK